MLKEVTNSKSKTFLAFCFCFLAGVAALSLLHAIRFDPFALYLALFGLAALLVFFWRKVFVRFLLCCILFFLFGAWRYLVAFPPDSPEYISYYNEEKETIIGYVSAEPDVRSDGVRYIIASQKIQDTKNKKQTKGNIYLKSGLYPRYEYGDVLEVDCNLKMPEPIEDFRYDMYLARFRVFSICASPKIRPVHDGNPSTHPAYVGGFAQDDERIRKGSALMRGILEVKNTVAEKINLLWHEPHASFMAGLLYGYRGGLGNLNELFSITGVTHIVAISGYNITIIATILITICIHVRIPRKKAFWLVSAGIVLFVLFAGGSASVVRAGIMGILVLLARQMGRMSRVGSVLVLTAVLMTLHNPFVLMWDAGFQLSFISTLGLVYITPLIVPWFAKIPEMLGLQESIVSTLSAIIATLPLILYQFGRLSIVAPIVNVLILWIIPFIMMLGFFAVFFSFLFFAFAEVLSWIAWAGLQYIITIVTWFAHLPFAAVEIQISVWLMIGAYVGMCIFVVKKKIPG